MAVPETIGDFLKVVRKSRLLEEAELDAYLERTRSSPNLPVKPTQMAGLLVRDGLLTRFQAELMLRGKYRGFNIGHYKVLDRLGSGGMSNVYLCQHRDRKNRVAVKVLGTIHADNPDLVKRFKREAQAIAGLNHPNVVRFYEDLQDNNLYFYVMEYIDGSSLQYMLQKRHPMDILRASHYVRQAAQGLQHIYEHGLVHRDIKPSNLLVDRKGVVKVLDLGLVLFSRAEVEVLTKTTLGSIDFIAPEQALDSHEVDIRVDIYSLGASFYYLLTGQTPLSVRQQQQPSSGPTNPFQPFKPVRELRPEVPPELAAIIDKMTSLNPKQRYTTPAEVVNALTPWTKTPIGPPPEDEMPLRQK